MAENYGTLEGTLDEHGVLSGEMNDRATLEGEIQFGSGGGGVLDVFQNGQSVVQGRYAYVTVPTFLKDLRSDDYHNTVTTLEIQNWNGKADPSDIPTALSQLDNDDNYVQDADYHHTDNNFTDDDKAAIGGIPENITDLSDVEVSNIQNGQVLKWDATQEKFVNANESGGGSGDVADVKVNGTSVVDPVTKEANIDLTGYAETSDIPTDLADLSDDSTHRLVTDTEKAGWDAKADTSDIPTVNNNTITIQKNGQNVDSFMLNQNSNKAINIAVPTKTSDLQNDSSFITNTVNNLANYYLKSQTYTQTEVDALIDAAINGRFQKVNVLPATGEPNVIYLVPKATPETSNACDEYIWQDNAWELIGSTDIDLSGYVTDDELTTALQDYLTTSAFNTAIANYYTKTEVGNLLDGKVDKVSGKGLSTYDYDATAKGIVDNVTTNLAGKVDKVNGKGLSTEDYTTTEKNKLAGISTGANKVESSTTNGNIRIDGTETQVYDGSGKVDKVNGKGLSTNDYDNTAKGIVDGVTAALADKVDKETGKGLSTNDYTTNEKNKLAGIAAGATKTASSTTNGNIKINDVETQVYDDSEIQDRLDTDTTSISGNPISISGLKSNQLAVNPIITLEPIQDLHGQSKPYPAGGGKNKLNLTIEALKQNNIGGTWSDNTYSFRGIVYTVLTDNAGNVIGINANGTNNTGNHSFFYAYANLPAGSYKVAGCPSGGSSSTWIIYTSAGVNDYGSGATFTLSSATLVETRCWVYNGATISNKVFYPMIYDASIGDATFAPYENICPISGYDKVEVESCGKNILEGEIANCAIDSSGLIYASSTTKMGYAKVGQGKTYTVKTDDSTLIGGLFLTKPSVGSVTYNGTRIVGAAGDYTFTAPITGYIAFRCTSAYTTLQIEEGSTSTTYTEPHNPTSISESLGQTVYRGSLDLRTGLFTGYYAKTILKQTDIVSFTDYGSLCEVIYNMPSDCAEPTAGGLPDCLCSKLLAVNGTTPIGTIIVCDGNRTGTTKYALATVAQMSQSDYATTYGDIEVLYQLATPFTIQLTPHEISLLKDYAYVSTNGTSIALDYHNGEMASLSDVSQLGETVNELGDKVSANDADTQVNLMTYNTSTNKYVCPSDGYISLSNAGASVGDYIIMSVYGANDNLICGLRCDTPVASMVTAQSLFVKRGMKCYVRATSSTGSFTALFTPLA